MLVSSITLGVLFSSVIEVLNASCVAFFYFFIIAVLLLRNTCVIAQSWIISFAGLSAEFIHQWFTLILLLCSALMLTPAFILVHSSKVIYFQLFSFSPFLKQYLMVECYRRRCLIGEVPWVRICKLCPEVEIYVLYIF